MAFDTVAAVASSLLSWWLAQLQCVQLPLEAQKVLCVQGFRNEVAPEVVLVRT